jgi:protein TonB
VTAFPLSGAGARFEDDATFAPVNRPNNWFARGGVSVRISASAILTLAGLFVIATGLGGAYVYHSLHPATVQRPAEVKPMAKPKAGLSYSSLDLDSQVIHAGPQPAPSSPSEPRATQAVRPKSTRQQVAMAVLAPDQQEALLDSVSEAAASVAASDAAPTQAATSRATAEAHIISPVHVSSTTMNGLALSAPRPVYPADQEKGISGTVVLEVSISKRGNVTDARAVSGPPALRRAAEQAVEEWRFRPYLVDGDPTEVTTTVGFFFNGR